MTAEREEKLTEPEEFKLDKRKELIRRILDEMYVWDRETVEEWVRRMYPQIEEMEKILQGEKKKKREKR